MGKSVKVDISEIIDIQNIMKRLSAMNIFELKKSMGVELEDVAKDRFDTKNKKSPDNEKWKEWSASYAKYANKDRRKSILVTEGILQESITSDVGNEGVYIGSTVIYAKTHQDGYKEKNIPARPFLGFGEEESSAIYSTIEEFIKAAGV